jgi:hypothetical protein
MACGDVCLYPFGYVREYLTLTNQHNNTDKHCVPKKAVIFHPFQ